MGIEPTGKHIDIEVADFIRFNAEGKVTEHWSYLDNLEFVRQLAVIPKEVVPGA